MENKLEVELINAKIYDFKTDDGTLIQGLKIFYRDTTIKEGSIDGDIVDNFFNSEKIKNYEEIFNKLKDYYLESKRNKVVPHVVLYYTIKSINEKPTITKIDFKH